MYTKLIIILISIIGYFSVLTEKKSTVVNDPVTGDSSGVIQLDSFIYSSSIDTFTNLFAKVAYDTGYENLPVLILMHGYSEEVADLENYIFRKFAGYKYMVCAVGMRGRDGANGTNNASGSELYDIYDAIQYIDSVYSGRISQTRNIIVGYSGGGGNALAMVGKFPDMFQVCVQHFGMADYGYTLDGWYYTNTTYQSIIESAIGGNPSNFPYLYFTRYSIAAINNYKGYLYQFHDTLDNSVSVKNANNIQNVFRGEIETHISDASDSERFLHGYPTEGSGVENSEKYWKNKIWDEQVINIPNIGNYRINGYLKTKKFEIRLGNMNDQVGEVQYNYYAKYFKISNLIDTIDIRLIIPEIGVDSSINNVTTYQIFDF